MSRSRLHTPDINSFTRHVSEYFKEFEHIHVNFEREKKSGKVSQSTVSSLIKLYNKSNLREKYILALKEIEERLRVSRRENANDYLSKVRKQLKELHKKDAIIPELQNESRWLEYIKSESESSERNRVRLKKKGGVDTISEELKKTIKEAKSLNKSAFGNKYIGQLLEEINKKIISKKAKWKYRSGAFIAISAIVSGITEYTDHLIGEEIKDTPVSETISGTETNTDYETPDTSAPDDGTTPDTGGEIPDGSGGDETIVDPVEIISHEVVFKAMEYLIFIIILVAIISIIIHVASSQLEKKSIDHTIDKNIGEVTAENLDKKIDAKSSRFNKRVAEIEEIQDFLKSR